jgi:hypothetical protein
VFSPYVGDSGFVAERGRLLQGLTSAEGTNVHERSRVEVLLVKMRRWRILVAFADSLRSILSVWSDEVCFVYSPMMSHGG